MQKRISLFHPQGEQDRAENQEKYRNNLFRNVKDGKFQFDSADYYQQVDLEKQRIQKEKEDLLKYQLVIEATEKEQEEKLREILKNQIPKKKQIRKKIPFDSADYFIQQEKQKSESQKKIKYEESNLKNHNISSESLEDQAEQALREQSQKMEIQYICSLKGKKKKSILIEQRKKITKFDSAEYFLEQQQQVQQVQVQVQVQQNEEEEEKDQNVQQQYQQQNQQKNVKQSLEKKLVNSENINSNNCACNNDVDVQQQLNVEDIVQQQARICEKLKRNKGDNQQIKKKQVFDSADYWLDQYNNNSQEQNDQKPQTYDQQLQQEYKQFEEKEKQRGINKKQSLVKQQQKHQSFDSADYFMNLHQN